MKKLLIPTFLIIILIGCSTTGQQLKLLNKNNDPEPFHAASIGRGTDSTGLFECHPNLEYRIIQIKRTKDNE